MVAVSRHRQQAAEREFPSRIPEHLTQPKRSPIAQRLAQEEAARLERARLASRRVHAVDPSLRLVDHRPLIETARVAPESQAGGGIIDCYARRSQRNRAHGTPLAMIPAPARIGRCTPEHYRRLHAGWIPSLRRMRIGRMGGNPHASIHGRMAIATLAALIVLIGAFGTSFAQQRYEVQDGDTLQSVADAFGVDPAAIAASSWMPDGDSLSAGQVIVIPDVGQSPADAAEMAAAQEGSSPWVIGAWWVDPGDTLDSIGAHYGLSGAQLAEFNGIVDDTNLQIGTRILIPLSRDDNNAAAAVTTTQQPDVTVPGVIFYPQSRNLSCEYAATHIATAAFGDGISEDTFIREVPIRLNPHLGYRGDIDGAWGNTDDYGVYPEALAPVLNDYGFDADIFYSFGDTSELTAQLDAGHPVVVWLGMWGDTRERMTDDGDYSVAAGMHVMTAYGYDADGLYLSDPAHGTEVFYTWDTFESMWTVLDGMSMAVYPHQS